VQMQQQLLQAMVEQALTLIQVGLPQQELA
jgi:hypothetical protein